MPQLQTLETDVVVIGAGPVGENVADRVVKGGLSCTIVEKDLVGGECSYWACMPSKALLRPTAAIHAARKVQGAAEAVTGNVDAAAVFARRNSFTSDWNDAGQVDWLAGAHISLIRGTASVVGAKRVRVARPGEPDVDLVARHAVVLANGSEPIIPNLPGLADVPFWGTREATSASEVPTSLAVIGGGVAAVELAQAFARLGSQVTIMARSGLLSKLPATAVELVEAALVDEGITILKGVSPARVSQHAGSDIVVELDNGDSVSAAKLLVSTGRRPAVAQLGLASVGLTSARLDVDDLGRVTNADGAAWLYAVGDVAGKVLLTHQGKYEARTTGDAIVAMASGPEDFAPVPWSRYRSTANAVAVPQVVFSDPEIVQVGKSLEEARAAGSDAISVGIPLNVAGASLLADGYTGWAEMIFDRERNVVIGATFVGQDVAELLHAATIAIVGEVPLDRLWHAVPSYPTMSEIWLRILEAYEQQWRDAGAEGRDPFNPAP